MKYYLLNAKFVENHVNGNQLQKAIKEHLDYLENGLNSGQILLSGPKVDAEGGIIIIKSTDFDEVCEFCKKDPIVVAGIQHYEIIEFTLYSCQNEIKKWFIK